MLSKIFRCMLTGNYSSWSASHQQVYHNLLGRRTIIGFEFEFLGIYDMIGDRKLSYNHRFKEIMSHLKKISDRMSTRPHVVNTTAHRDSESVEITVAFMVDNAKWYEDFKFFYSLLYQVDGFSGGYHQSYNYVEGRIRTKKTRHKLRFMKKYLKWYERFFGELTNIRYHRSTEAGSISAFPWFHQFDTIRPSLLPQQILLETFIREQVIEGIDNCSFKYRKINRISEAFINTLPRRYAPLFTYPPDSTLELGLRQRKESGLARMTSSSLLHKGKN